LTIPASAAGSRCDLRRRSGRHRQISSALFGRVGLERSWSGPSWHRLALSRRSSVCAALQGTFSLVRYRTEWWLVNGLGQEGLFPLPCPRPRGERVTKWARPHGQSTLPSHPRVHSQLDDTGREVGDYPKFDLLLNSPLFAFNRDKSTPPSRSTRHPIRSHSPSRRGHRPACAVSFHHPVRLARRRTDHFGGLGGLLCIKSSRRGPFSLILMNREIRRIFGCPDGWELSCMCAWAMEKPLASSFSSNRRSRGPPVWRSCPGGYPGRRYSTDSMRASAAECP
jgi:hypothetical protein